MFILLRPLCILLLLSSSGAVQSPARPPSLPADVLEWEEAGRLEEALASLEPQVAAQENRVQNDVEAHVALLRETIRTLHLVSVYQKDGQEEWAKAALETLLGKLDPFRDGNLMVVVAKKLGELQAAVAREEEKEARAQLAAAAALLDAGRYDEALAVYGAVARLKPGEVPRNVIREARLGENKVALAKARALAPGFWRDLGTSGTTGARRLAEWLVYFAAAVLLVLFLATVRGRLPARPGTVVTLQDLTVPAAEREARSQHLVREFLQKIQRATHDDSSAASLDAFEDLDGVGLANLRVDVDPLAEARTFLQDGAAIQIGPFSLKPQQFLTWLGSWFRRQSESVLRGSLSNEGDQIVLTVEHLAPRDGRLQPGSWEVVESGPGARASAVEKMAKRIAFELSGSKLTTSWQSFDLYRDAMKCLAQENETENREECLEKAWDLLRKSLYGDPANWLARFNLATVDRKLGRRDIAAEQFEFLNRMFAEQAETRPLSEFLGSHPEFVYTVQYNWAVSLTDSEDSKARAQALWILDELIRGVSGAQGGAPTAASTADTPALAKRSPLESGVQRLRIEMLARSARASALCRQFMAEEKEKRDESFASIKQEKNWFESLRLDTSGLDWRAYALAYAVAQTAFARACLRYGFFRVAMEAFRKATMMSPDFVDAYNNQAAVYLDRRRRQDPDWISKAEELLLQALRISGSNQKSHYLLGKLYAQTAIGRFAEAKEHLEKASLISSSHFYLAQIHALENDLKGALEILRRSIYANGSPDRRYVSFIENALEYSQERRGDRALLEEARGLAVRYLEAGKGEKDREKAFRQRLVDKINEALAAMAFKGSHKEKGTPAPPVNSGGADSSLTGTPAVPPSLDGPSGNQEPKTPRSP